MSRRIPQKSAISTNSEDRLRIYHSVVNDIARLASSNPDFDDFMHQVLHHVGRATQIERVKILRYRPDHGDCLVIAGTGWKEGVVGKATLPVGLSSPPGRTIQTGDSTAIENLPDDPEYKYSGLLKDHNIVSVVNSPIGVEGGVWGVLEADSQERTSFSEDTVRFLDTVASLLGAAIQRKETEKKILECEGRRAREVTNREVLLRELQHRVKNNFQIITSLMILHQKRAKEKESHEIIKSLSERITAIMLAHDQLSPGQDLRLVNLKTYLEALCREMNDYADGVEIQSDIEPSEVAMDMAVNLGLVVNELVTNAIKHAFDGPGVVRVELRTGSGIRESCLSVIDNGKGLGPARSGGMGERICQSLAAQFGGRIVREKVSKGTTVRVFFPPPPPVQLGTSKPN
jgi:two-component system, sensor histidine kinase PdtaS